MTTRRAMLIGAAGAGWLAACRSQPAQPRPGDRLLVRHNDGLGLFEVGTRQWLAQPATATATGLVLASLSNGELSIRDTQTGRISSEGALPGTWVPRAVHGTQVALIEGKLAPRASTKLLVMRGGKEGARY